MGCVTAVPTTPAGLGPVVGDGRGSEGEEKEGNTRGGVSDGAADVSSPVQFIC